jgi:serine protease Do
LKLHVNRWIWLVAFGALASQPVLAQSTHETIEQTFPRMVKIFGAGGLRNLHAYGTGFLVSPAGHVATVYSHVLDADSVVVVLGDGRRFTGEVLGAEPQLDLAVMKLQAENVQFPYFDLEHAGSASPGTRILAFSNMFKVASGDEPVSVLRGVIASRTNLSARRGAHEIPYNGPVFIVDAVSNNPGAGGGVITTRDGRLLGMIGRELRNSRSQTWINYAIPATELRDAIDQIISGRFDTSGDEKTQDEPLAHYRSLDLGLVMVPNTLYRTPCYVDSVIRDSAAASAGLLSDDLILFVNEELVQSVRMLNSRLRRLEAGDTVRIIVRRGDKLETFELLVPRKER